MKAFYFTVVLLIVIPQTLADDCACPRGFEHVTPLGLCVGSEVQNGNDWNSNEHACETRGGKLVTIYSAFYNTLLGAIAAQSFAQAPVMIGLRRLNDTWLWPDGTPGNYTNWAAGNPPNPDDPSKNCAWLNAAANNQWVAAPCASKNPYLCQFSTSLNKCLPGWSYFAQTNKCYLIGHDLSFVDANAFCIRNSVKEFPGKLASIHSQAEGDFVKSLAQDDSCQGDYPLYKGSTLIGGVYSGTDLKYWLDGTPTDYKNFCNISVNLDDSVILLRAVGEKCTAGCGNGGWLSGIDSFFSTRKYPSFVCRSDPLCNDSWQVNEMKNIK